jgi:hypothetical protein
VNLVPLHISKLHREIEGLSKVEAFLTSIRRGSVRTAINYKTSLAYFQEFLSNCYGHTVESILNFISDEKGNKSYLDVYTVLEKFITFMQYEKKVSAVSINQYLNGIRSLQ